MQKSIADYAVTYKMKVGTFSPTRSLQQIKAKTKEEFKLDDEKRTTGVVYLIKKSFTEPLTLKEAEIRRFFNKNTIRLGYIDIVPSQNYFAVWDFINKTEPEFKTLAAEFKRDWETIIKPQSLDSLAELRDAVKHMDIWHEHPDFLDKRNHFTFKKNPIGDPNQVANLQGLTDDMKAALEQEIREDNKEIEDACMEKLREELKSYVEDFHKKFSNYKEGYTRVSPSITSHIAEFAEMLPKLMVREDDELQDLATDAKILSNWDIDVLKSSEVARKEATTTAQGIADSLKF